MQLVERCILIIELYQEESSENWFGVNEILKKTGSLNRPGIIKTITVLEKEGILRTIESKNHLQLRPKELIPLGIEILELIKGIKKIEQLDIKLQKSHNDFNIILAKKNGNKKEIKLDDHWDKIKEHLINDGWDEDHLEYEKYETHGRELYTVKSWFNHFNSYDRLVFSSLVFRYFSINKKYKLKKITKEITFNIIMNALDNLLMRKERSYRDDKFIRLSDVIKYTPTIDDIFSSFFNELLYTWLANQEEWEIGLEILKILNPKKEEINRVIENIKENIKEDQISKGENVDVSMSSLKNYINYELVEEYEKLIG